MVKKNSAFPEAELARKKINQAEDEPYDDVIFLEKPFVGVNTRLIERPPDNSF